MKIVEIFKSIQGEGQQAGEITTFIRTAGCNFRCKWCDTKYAYEGGKEMTIADILKEVLKLDCQNICITGGEPLLQKNMYGLLYDLAKNNFNVFVETNGSQNIDIGVLGIRYVLDFKLPSSGMYGKFDYDNLNHNPYEIKFVIATKEDYQYAKQFAELYQGDAKLLFSPCWGSMPKRELAEMMIKDNLPVRYSLQIHKVLWDKNKRGV